MIEPDQFKNSEAVSGEEENFERALRAMVKQKLMMKKMFGQHIAVHSKPFHPNFEEWVA